MRKFLVSLAIGLLMASTITAQAHDPRRTWVHTSVELGMATCLRDATTLAPKGCLHAFTTDDGVHLDWLPSGVLLAGGEGYSFDLPSESLTVYTPPSSCPDYSSSPGTYGVIYCTAELLRPGLQLVADLPSVGSISLTSLAGWPVTAATACCEGIGYQLVQDDDGSARFWLPLLGKGVIGEGAQASGTFGGIDVQSEPSSSAIPESSDIEISGSFVPKLGRSSGVIWVGPVKGSVSLLLP